MMSVVKALALAAVVVGTFSGTPAHAEPTSGRVKIYQVRPYMGEPFSSQRHRLRFVTHLGL